MKILVLDIDWNQTAYLVAELSRAGVETVVAAPALPNPRGLGRYCRQIRSPPIEDAAYPRFLAEVVRAERADVALPTCEPIQQMLWEMQMEGATRIFPSTTPLQRELLSNRWRLYQFMTELGVPIPRVEPITQESDLDGVIEMLGLPCVLRGTQGMSGMQVRIATNAAEVSAAYKALRSTSPEPPFAQQYLDGRRCLIGALFDHGRPLQWFSQTTIESCPAPAGPSVRVRSLRDPVLTDLATRIFRALEWDGLACAEFIQQTDGGYHFLEINPRAWAAIRAAHSCGVPLLRLFVDYLLGRRPVHKKPFPNGQECTLFPAFFAARIREGAFPRVADLRAYSQAIAAAPWTQPALMRHFLRVLWWTYDASRRARSADPPDRRRMNSHAM